jgi:NAD(P)-dependent dehydrogenase (short-subunit alcohol dehydrogenase family)
MPPLTGVLDLDVSDLRRVVDSNLVGCFLATKRFAPIMILGGCGRISYVSSMMGVQAGPGGSANGATKAGVSILANVAHRELADLLPAPAMGDGHGEQSPVFPCWAAAACGRAPTRSSAEG